MPEVLGISRTIDKLRVFAQGTQGTSAPLSVYANIDNKERKMGERLLNRIFILVNIDITLELKKGDKTDLNFIYENALFFSLSSLQTCNHWCND